MRQSLLVAVATVAIAAPATARDHSFYVGIEAGVLKAQKSHVDIIDPLFAEKDYAIVRHKTGYDVDLIAGYDFGMFRLEAEIAQKHASHKHYTFEARDPVPIQSDANGRSKVFSAMGNALLDFGNDNGLGFSVGGGLGYAKSDISILPTVTYIIPTRLKDSGLAWQLLAEARYAVTPNVDVGLKYRYFNSGRIRADANYGLLVGEAQTRFRSHSLLASLIYNFGTPAMAPAPVVMAPPPPPPAPEPVQTQVCYDGSVIAVTSVCPSPPPPPAPAPQPGERG